MFIGIFWGMLFFSPIHWDIHKVYALGKFSPFLILKQFVGSHCPKSVDVLLVESSL